MRRVSPYVDAFALKYPPGDVKFHLGQAGIPEVSIQYLIPVSFRPINKSLTDITCSLAALKMKNKNSLVLLALVIITSIIVVLTDGGIVFFIIRAMILPFYCLNLTVLELCVHFYLFMQKALLLTQKKWFINIAAKDMTEKAIHRRIFRNFSSRTFCQVFIKSAKGKTLPNR